MTIYTFPQERQTFTYFGPGEPIRQAGSVSVRVYADQAATTPAVIHDLAGDLIVGSVLWIDSEGMLPEFKGPDGVTLLWGKMAEESSTYRLDARYAEWLTGNGLTQSQVSSLITAALGVYDVTLKGGVSTAYDTLVEIVAKLNQDATGLTNLLTLVGTLRNVSDTTFRTALLTWLQSQDIGSVPEGTVGRVFYDREASAWPVRGDDFGTVLWIDLDNASSQNPSGIIDGDLIIRGTPSITPS